MEINSIKLLGLFSSNNKMNFFSNIKILPKDPIIGLTELFVKDTRPNKLNLGVGVYFDETGKIPLLSSVQKAQHRISKNVKSSSGYLPIDGSAKYCSLVQELLFGPNNPLVDQKKIITFQTLGGTGAIKIGAEFLKRIKPNTTIAISNPSWENHRSIFESSGLNVTEYPYYDFTNNKLKLSETLEKFHNLPKNSVVVLHACCHNPTGIDPDDSQWLEIINTIKLKEHIPFIDIAYQGFDQDLEFDSRIVRLFSDTVTPTIIANSFSKNFSLYGERVGALTIKTPSSSESNIVLSHVKKIIRSSYSNPPTYGQKLVTEILTENSLKEEWVDELKLMRDRIIEMRKLLVELLKNQNLNKDFSFIKKQKGMFSFSGLTSSEVEKLRNNYGVYILSSGRICIAAINKKNISYVAESISKVIGKKNN